mgnify:CR=1 FL=1
MQQKLPKLYCPTVRKKCSSDQENLLKFEVEGREFAKILRSLGKFIQTVVTEWSGFDKIEQFKLKKNIGI